jgi:DNA-binding HxlR family transcriptional regulator
MELVEAKHMPTECDLIAEEAMEEHEVLVTKELDQDIIRMLEADGGTLAFQGLRRRMNIHQEKLSRALQRLEEDGYVQRMSKGYALTQKGSSLAQRWLIEPPKAYSTILQSFLPGDLSPLTMAHHLEGRWFHNLRWLGIKEEGDHLTLRWVTEASGIEVMLHLAWGQVRVETDAVGQEHLIEALMGAQKVFGYLTEPWQEDWERMHRGTNLLGWSDRHHAAG